MMNAIGLVDSTQKRKRKRAFLMIQFAVEYKVTFQKQNKHKMQN